MVITTHPNISAGNCFEATLNDLLIELKILTRNLVSDIPPHHVISVKVGLQLNKTVCKTKFIKPKSPKAPKTSHLALCFSLRARVESCVDIVKRRHVRAFNKSFPLSL